MYGMLNRKPLDGWIAIFLATTVLTSLTGYLFPFMRLLPSHIVGAISLVALAVAIYARYARHMNGAWRSIYVVTAVLALYLNSFVAVVQVFEKVPAAHALAPKQKEPPFLIVQGAALVFFVVLGIAAVIKFRPGVALAA